MTGNSHWSAFLLKDATFFQEKSQNLVFAAKKFYAEKLTVRMLLGGNIMPLIHKPQKHKKDIEMIIKTS